MSEVIVLPATGLATRVRRRMPLLIVLCFGFVTIVTVFAILGPVIAPKDPNAENLLTTLKGPSRDYWLGTDNLGRDVLSRTIVGARTAVVGPIVIALGAMLVGSTLGLIAGYQGGWIDSGIMRWVDLMYALPSLLVAIVVVGVLGGGYILSVALLTVFYAPQDVRIIRGLALEQRSLPYVEAARNLGLSKWRIMFRHIWPNTLPVVIANTFLHFAFGLVSLSALSFLGLGIGPGTPDWGRMLSDNRLYLFGNPAAALAPGVMIVLASASMNLIGDWVYERLAARGQVW